MTMKRGSGRGNRGIGGIVKRLLRNLSSDLDADLVQIRAVVLGEHAPIHTACDDEELRITWARRQVEGVAFSARP